MSLSPSTRVWPVIHVRDPATALSNAALAAQLGAHGVFLIQMEGNDGRLDPIAKTIKEHYPPLVLGVNYLSMEADFALGRAIRQEYQASWTDNPGVRSDSTHAMGEACADQLRHYPDHEFFAAVAFKYQRVDPDPAGAAQKALAMGMLPTTSGAATGVAPDVEKLAAIRAGIGPEARLAVASGVTPENAAAMKPFVTDFLVATGIGQDFYTFDQGKLEALMRAVL
jgi:hypothetical protein